MVRVLGIILIVIGLVVFFGNFTGVIHFLPGSGILLVIIGGTIFALSETFDALPPGNEE